MRRSRDGGRPEPYHHPWADACRAFGGEKEFRNEARSQGFRNSAIAQWKHGNTRTGRKPGVPGGTWLQILNTAESYGRYSRSRREVFTKEAHLYLEKFRMLLRERDKRPRRWNLLKDLLDLTDEEA